MNSMLSRRRLLALSGASLAALAAPVRAQSAPLRLAFIPQENPEKLLGDIEAITAGCRGRSACRSKVS